VSVSPVRALGLGAEMDFKSQNGRTQWVMPELALYDVLLLED